MREEHLHIQRLISGGIITTYHCPSRCAHCLYRAGPHRAVSYIDEVTTRQSIETLLRLQCQAVHIGGGEPFVDIDGLIMVISSARELGLGIDYVETNSSWFTDLETAWEILGRLRDAGLHTLLVSISPFHNAHIPFTQVKGVLEACRRSGVAAFPWIMDFYEELASLDEKNTHSMTDFEAAHGRNYLRRIPARYWIHLGGRSLETFGRVFERQPYQAILDESPGGCRELIRTEHFHVDLYGNYVPGLCAGLSVKLADLGAPLDPDRYRLLTMLYRDGILGLFEYASAVHKFEPRPAGYLSKCDLCDDIRRHLVCATGLNTHELQPRNFYLDRRVDPQIKHRETHV